jgi:hypothetical protein
MDRAVTSSKNMAIQLKESMSEECESEKESLRDQVTKACDKEKDDLKSQLRNNLKLFSKKAISDAAKTCTTKMADFKQSYLEKY